MPLLRFKASALFIALAFALPCVASPLDAQYAERGYDRLVQRGSILPTSQYSKAIRDAIALMGSGMELEEAAQRTGVKVVVLQKILRLGTPIPAVDPSTAIQATVPLPVPQLPQQKLTRPPSKRAVRIKKSPKPQPKVEAVAYQEPPTNNRFVEGWGLGQFEGDQFGPVKLKAKQFSVSGDFFAETTQSIESSESSLSPSQRALQEIHEFKKARRRTALQR